MDIQKRMQELKPCPFCGEQAQIRIKTDSELNDYYYIKCENNLCYAKSGYCKKEEWAIKRWNRRTNDDLRT